MNDSSDQARLNREQLQKLVEIGLGSTSVEILQACLLSVHAAGLPLRELCRKALEKTPRLSQEACLVFAPHDCLDVFCSLLKHPDWKVRRDAVKTLRHVGGDAITAALQQASEDDAEMVSYFATRALGHREEAEVAQRTALVAPDSRQRAIVAALLGAPVRESDLPELAALVLHDDADLCATAKQHIRSDPGGRSGDCLLALYQGSDAFRRQAGHIVAEVVGERALPALISNLCSPYREVRNGAASGLELLGTPAIAAVVLALPDISLAPARLSALETLKRLAPYRRDSSDDGFPRPQTVRNVAPLLRDRLTRRAAIEVLGASRDTSAYGPLLEVLDSPNPRDAKAALDSCRSLIHAVGNIPAAFVEKVARLTRAADPQVRSEALTVLVPLLGQHGSAIDREIVRCLVENIGAGGADEVTSSLRGYSAIVDDGVRALVSEGKVRAEEVQALVGIVDSLREEEEPRSRRPDSDSENLDALSSGSLPGDWAVPTDAAHEEVVTEDAVTEDAAPDESASVVSSFAMRYRLSLGDRQRLPQMSASMAVTAPGTVAPGSRFVLSFWLYQGRRIGEILAEAQALSTDVRLRAQAKFGVRLPREELVEVRLDLPGFRLQDPADTLFWDGEMGSCTFRIEVPADTAPGQHFGQATLWLSRGIRVAKLDFVLEVDRPSTDIQDLTVSSQRMDTAFASYAREDKQAVLARVSGMQAVLPALDIFLDVVSARAGENWQERIFREIEARDAFLLFWSSAASRSHWVGREWKAALEAKGLEGIFPIPIESPDVAPPPKELSSLHFSDWTLAIS